VQVFWLDDVITVNRFHGCVSRARSGERLLTMFGVSHKRYNFLPHLPTLDNSAKTMHSKPVRIEANSPLPDALIGQ